MTCEPSVSTTGGRLSSDQENLILYLPFETSSHGSGLSVDLLGFFNFDSAHLSTSCLSASNVWMTSSPTTAAKEDSKDA